MVNDLVLTVEPGADLKAVETALLAEASERHPDAHLNPNPPMDGVRTAEGG